MKPEVSVVAPGASGQPSTCRGWTEHPEERSGGCMEQQEDRRGQKRWTEESRRGRDLETQERGRKGEQRAKGRAADNCTSVQTRKR